MSNWFHLELAKVKEFFTSETAKLKADVSALESRIAALESAAVKAVEKAV